MNSPVASDECNSGKPSRDFLAEGVPAIRDDLNRLIEFARQAGYHADVLWNDALFRARTAALQAELDALELTLTRVAQGSGPAIDELAILARIAGLRLQHAVSRLIADALGPFGLAQGPAEDIGSVSDGLPGRIEAPGAALIFASTAPAKLSQGIQESLREFLAASIHRGSRSGSDSIPPDADARLRDSIDRFAAAEYASAQRSTLLATDRDNWGHFAAMGWLGQGIPEDAGGHAGDLSAMMIVAERLGAGRAIEPYTGCIVYPSQVLQTLLDPPEAARLLAPAVAGHARLAMACHEAAARGGLRWTETRASADGGGYTLNGCKVTVDGGGRATAYLVSARTAGEVYDPIGHSLFLVPRETPGLKVRAWRTIDGSDMAAIELDGVRVPGEALLGKPGAALGALSAGMDAAIVSSAFGVLGAMEAAVAGVASFLNDDAQVGGALREAWLQGHIYANMRVALEQARSAALAGLASLSQPDARRRSYVTSATKAVVVRSSNLVGRQLSQLHGQMGTAEDGCIDHFVNYSAVANSQRGSLDFHLSRMSMLM